MLGVVFLIASTLLQGTASINWNNRLYLLDEDGKITDKGEGLLIYKGGTVCKEYFQFGMEESQRVCKAMGFRSVKNVVPELVHDFQEMYPVILDEGRCTFSEQASCQYESESHDYRSIYNQCSDHNGDIWLMCGDSEDPVDNTCTAGQYWDKATQKCEECPENFYSDKASFSCSRCPVNTVSKRGSASCSDTTCTSAVDNVSVVLISLVLIIVTVQAALKLKLPMVIHKVKESLEKWKQRRALEATSDEAPAAVPQPAAAPALPQRTKPTQSHQPKPTQSHQPKPTQSHQPKPTQSQQPKPTKPKTSKPTQPRGANQPLPQVMFPAEPQQVQMRKKRHARPVENVYSMDAEGFDGRVPETIYYDGYGM